jgi:SAM-dependent methyltransferase
MQDKDRPAALAHLRFAAARAAFSNLDLAARFRLIHQSNLWGAESSASGLGSEGDATGHLRQELPELLRKLAVASILDAPCGDGGWISDLPLGVAYIGVDIVPELIVGLRDRAAREGTDRIYVLADITRDPLPRADAVLCRDCLVHLSFSNIQATVSNFRRSGSEWLIATTFPGLNTNVDCEDGDWRALNFERSPFSWDAPAHLLVEGCMEGDGGWTDKSLAAWRLADLPP